MLIIFASDREFSKLSNECKDLLTKMIDFIGYVFCLQSENMMYDKELESGVRSSEVARGMSSLTYRESVIKCIMEGRQELYTDSKPISVYIASWNVNGQSPGSICLKDWLAKCPENVPDIYAIGFQELDLSKEVFLFNDTPMEPLWL